MRRVLIANRGEIALRVIRSLHAMGLEAALVYSEADAGSLPVRSADLALPIGPAPSTESYLRAARIIDAARRAGCQAIHPGYGFLAERADFARAVEEAGLLFIGPRPDSIDRFGKKTSSREALRELGIPPVAGSASAIETLSELKALVRTIGFPLILKAAAGGGGKGIRIVRHAAELDAAWTTARSEAESSFGSTAMLAERYLERARHVEVQVLGDGRGGVRVFSERDCSTQRRLQKVLEETPCPTLAETSRERLLSAAAAAMAKERYRGAGTLEFLLAEDGELFFLEMNTRIQVEHPITEVTTGVDLVREQVEIAAGRELPSWRDDLDSVLAPASGAAVEFRVNAEDPTKEFLPATGAVSALRLPAGPGVRVDSALEVGSVVTPHYDSLIAKIIAHAPERRTALLRLHAALSECLVGGVVTNLPLGVALCADSGLLAAENHCQYLAERLGCPEFLSGSPAARELPLIAAAAAWLWARGAHGGLPAGSPQPPQADTDGAGALPRSDAWRLRPGEWLPYWSEAP